MLTTPNTLTKKKVKKKKPKKPAPLISQLTENHEKLKIGADKHYRVFDNTIIPDPIATNRNIK